MLSMRHFLALCMLPTLLLVTEVRQSFKKDSALWVKQGDPVPTRIEQTGKIKRYTEQMLTDGVHFQTGGVVDLSADIIGKQVHNGGLIGVHGKGTDVRFSGHWKGDEGGGYPMLVLRDRGKMVWTPEATVDFVMASNFFTRQLWVWGDGTGVLELEEGFRSDLTEGGTVPNAMGTIRLNGATLITHHTLSLPYNTRPDGRGGLYHNGHIVFEGETPSTWSIRSTPHRYFAQLDFATDTTLDLQAPLTHSGTFQVCLPVGNSGPFTSTGAFRTTKPGATITKTGPAMLSLEGQQGWHPDSTLDVKEGLLRIHTDPAQSDRLGGEYGNHLNLIIRKDAKVVFAAPTIRLASLTVEPGATVWHLDGVTLEVDGSVISSAATSHTQGM